MSIEKVIVPYEILFRLSEGGTVAGCHRRDLEIVREAETGEVYSAKELGVKPIEGAAMDAVLGVINTSQAETIFQQNKVISQSSEIIENLKSVLAEKENQIQHCVSEIDRLTNELAASLAGQGVANAGAE